VPVVPLVSVPRRYSTACGGADELKAYDFKVSCYVQAGRGRTYAEKVDAGPLCILEHLQTFSSFGGFQVFKF
jgi:hypothetical protein